MNGIKLPLGVITSLGLAALLCCCSTQSPQSTSASGFTAYFGAEEPGLSPERFAPTVLPPEGGVMHSSPTFSPDGTEAYFSAFFPDQEPRLDVIMFLEWEGNEWSSPQIAAFSGEFDDDWPWFSPDGNRLYFSSVRPPEEGGEIAEEYGLWYVEREESGWSSPRQITSPADFGRDEGAIYIAATLPGGYGDMDIYRLGYVGDTYAMPENLGPAVNTSAEEYGPCVASDESYLVFSRFEESRERHVDLYVSFFKSDGTWSEAQNLGESIEAFQGGRFPVLSLDGRYLFFVAEDGKAIYWVDARAVEQCWSGE